MKIKYVSLFLMLIFIAPFVIQAAEDYTSINVEGVAPITIDGELIDWDWIEQEWWNLGFVYTSSKQGLPESKEDLSAQFMCICDSIYLYVAVKVNDDSLVFGQEIFGRSFMDDSVEIYFDGDSKNVEKEGFDINDGLIRVSLDRYNQLALEGYPMIRMFNKKYYPQFSREQYPYLWEELGIKTAINRSQNGYNVEMAIPTLLLGWRNDSKSKSLGMHLVVNDDDDGYDRESKIGWVIDGNNETWEKTALYRQITFNKIVYKTGNNISINTAQINHILDILDTIPDVASEYSYNLLEKEDIWADILLAEINNFALKSDESIIALNHFIDKCNDERMLAWAKNKLGTIYLSNNQAEKALDEFEEVYNITAGDSLSILSTIDILRNFGDAYLRCGLFQEALDMYDILYETIRSLKFQAAEKYELQPKYRELALEYYDYIINNSDKRYDIENAKLGTARILYYLGLNKRAKEICEQLMDIENYSISLGAKNLVYTINFDEILNN